MFRKDAIDRAGSSSNTLTLDSHLVGSLEVPGSLEVLGHVRGPIRVGEAIYVGPSAVVEGDIEARSARIAGQVEGNLTAHEGVDLLTGARLTGDVLARSFRIEDGAIFKGQCHMGDRGFDEEPSALYRQEENR